MKKIFLSFLAFILLSSCTTSSGTSALNSNSPLNHIDSTETKNQSNKLEVKTGAQRVELYLPLIKDKKVAIVTNQTGIVPNASEKDSIKWVSIVDFLIEQNIQVEKIFAPEHGFRGNQDAGAKIKNGKDNKTGLPILSLYGKNKKPTQEQLKDIELILFDIQDVGTRFYTYLSTLHYVLEAAGENNIEVILLDRPNPNIHLLDGPVLEKEVSSFVGLHPVPIVYGMTIGEYGKMIIGEKWIDGNAPKFTVVECKNYYRNSSYSLPIAPSPNLPNDLSIALYPSLCLFEGTTISVGRGTDAPFQIYGSPTQPKSSYSFTPEKSYGAAYPKHKGKVCYGKKLDLTNINQEKLDFSWLINAYQNDSQKDKFFNENNFFDKLAGNKVLKEQIKSGNTEAEIRNSWQKDLKYFKEIRKKYLIYSFKK